MYCKQCGKPTINNQELCDECMARQNNANPVYQTSAQETSSVNNAQTQSNNNYSNYSTPNYSNYNQNTQSNDQTQGQYNQYTNNNNYVPNSNPKSKIVAGILGILLGSFGVHNFYLGYTGKAVAQLLISLLSCGTLAVISSIWGLVEGIMILTGSINTDGHGNPISE